MRRRARTWVLGLVLMVMSLIVPSASYALEGAPDQVGQWGPVLNWGVQAKHMTLLNNGKVLVWSQGDQARIWDPATGQFELSPAPFGDVHCAGQVTLADGRVMIVGGQNVNTHVGIPVTSIYDPRTNTWSRGTDMAFARWYPTLTTLADGRALVTSGDASSTKTRVDTPEIYDPRTDTWTKASVKQQGLYPFMYQLPSGKVYEAGPSTSTSYFDAATGTWSGGPTAKFSTNGYSESGAMYETGKILRAGGGDPAQAATQVVDMNTASPQWASTAPMANARRRMNTPILLDGSIMAVGGTRTSDDESQAVLEGEIWSPVTKTWSRVASMSEARMYHSTALTLPDGRVVTAGGEGAGIKRAQIYTPPYFFKGSRPQITSSPGSAAYGSPMLITTDRTDIAKVALMRPSAVTHAIDMNQRYMSLNFTKSGNQISATAPANGNYAPPGYYMLIAVDANGIPSIAKWVLLGDGGGTPPPPPPPPPPPVSNAPIADFTATTRSGNAPLTVDFSDISTNSPTLRSWDLNGDGVEDSTTATPQFTYTTPGTYTVKLRATNADGFDDEVKTGWITVTDPGAPPPPPPPPPPGGAAQAFSAIADSHVRSTAPTKNYGTANPLRVRQGTGTADTYMTFLKFNVTGLTSAPASAKVRMFVTDASPDGGSLFKVANTWTEMGLTYGNAPSLGTTSLSSAGATTTGKWVEWNATSAVTGNGEVSFAVKTTSSNSSYYTSREATANRPELVVSGTSTGPPSVAPTADFTAAPRTGTGPLTVSFTDTSTGGATSWSWDFDGNGTPDSAVQNPTFTYTAPGTYDVRLTATNGGGSDQEVKLGHIVVSPAGTPSTTDTFSPIADAHVKSTSPTKNYGADTSLRLRQGTAASPDTYRSYLKFDVAGLSGAPASAKLRLFVTDASPDGGSVFAVSNAWTETALTWSNAPALGVASLSSAGATAVGTWVELDVTTAVLGNGPVSFALTTTSSNSGYFTSREGTAINRPQLVISAGSAKTATARAAARQLHLRSIVASTPTFLCPLETGAKATRA